MKRITIKSQLALSLALHEWHGGQSSAVYAVASCMLFDSQRGWRYDPEWHRGHAGPCGSLQGAISELRNLRAHVNFPEAVTAKDEKECAALASKLETYFLK